MHPREYRGSACLFAALACFLSINTAISQDKSLAAPDGYDMRTDIPYRDMAEPAHPLLLNFIRNRNELATPCRRYAHAEGSRYLN